MSLTRNKNGNLEVFGVQIREGRDNFLSLDDLIRAVNSERCEYGMPEREAESILNSQKFAQVLFYLAKEKHWTTSELPLFLNVIKNEGVVPVMKKMGVYKISGVASTQTVMLNPYIWIIFTMELTPMLILQIPPKAIRNLSNDDFRDDMLEKNN